MLISYLKRCCGAGYCRRQEEEEDLCPVQQVGLNLLMSQHQEERTSSAFLVLVARSTDVGYRRRSKAIPRAWAVVEAGEEREPRQMNGAAWPEKWRWDPITQRLRCDSAAVGVFLQNPWKILERKRKKLSGREVKVFFLS